MIRLESKVMAKAIERARAQHPKVKVISVSDRVYSVTGSKGAIYTVKFCVVRGMRLAECDCIAGSRESLCYHVCAAAQVNIMVQSMRGSAPAPASLPDRSELIRQIESTWQAKYPRESLAANLMARFKCNSLSFLNADFLRRILAAIKGGPQC